ncbi:MAG TPA: cytochrome c3 family protein, partial [Longimicrobiales bacterium]|nr:cytochrome c3 family protein [Longimicrobiales bacterium]
MSAARARAPWLLLLLLPVLGPAAAGEPSPQRFPHPQHERLFPICEGCHAGVATGRAAETYPDPAECARCHDGTRAERVEWEPPAPRASNVLFSHPEHLEASARGGERAECLSCHAAGGQPSRMAVDVASPAVCGECHAHRATSHLAGSVVCSRCHLSLDRVPLLPAERVGRFPRPEWHRAADHLSTHGRQESPRSESCTVCHARETCERCHANAARLPQVQALPRDARVAALERGRAAEYPLPEDHGGRHWDAGHGPAAARADASCDNCHTRPSCDACHRRTDTAAGGHIARLPEREEGEAPGVTLAEREARVHPGGPAAAHGTWAATGRLACAQCHSNSECAACHAGSESREFHLPNFVQRHA